MAQPLSSQGMMTARRLPRAILLWGGTALVTMLLLANIGALVPLRHHRILRDDRGWIRGLFLM